MDTAPPVASITGPRPGDEFLSSRAVGVWGTGRSDFYGELTGGELEWTVRDGTTVVATADRRGADVHARRRQPTRSS